LQELELREVFAGSERPYLHELKEVFARTEIGERWEVKGTGGERGDRRILNFRFICRSVDCYLVGLAKFKCNCSVDVGGLVVEIKLTQTSSRVANSNFYLLSTLLNF